MDFSDVHKFNLNNENTRKQKGIPTFKSLLAGVSINEMKPNPLKCHCGNYPKIEQNGDDFDALCPNEECDNHLFNVGRTYQEAIFQWNESPDVELNVALNKIHPLAWYTAGFDNTDYLLKQIDKIESSLSKIEGSVVTNKEARLIQLIRGWNHFATVIASRIEKQEKPFVNEANDSDDSFTENPLEKNPKVTNKQTDSRSDQLKEQDIENRHYIPDAAINGPMLDYKDQIQILGNAYYWFVEGHMVRTKICKHTQWRIPTYIVYVRNKGTRAGYQVRIDLRSIGIPYYSKMFNCEDIYDSLADALINLKDKLKTIKHTRKLGRLIDRTKIKGNKAITLDDIKGVRAIRSLWDSNHRVEVTLSSPSDKSKARLQWSIGGKTTLTYSAYESSIKQAIKLYLLHTKLSCKKAFSHGAKVPLGELDAITQMKVIEVVGEHFNLSDSDTAYYLTRLNPNVHIGYVSASSLREDNLVSVGNYPMQILANKNKRGYLSGQIKKHDILNNAECVCIDSILLSNFDEYVYQPSHITFREAKPEMGLLLSKRAVEITAMRSPDINEKYQDIDMLYPESLVDYMQEGSLVEIGNDKKTFEGKTLEYEEDDSKIILYVNGEKTLANTNLEEWKGSHQAARKQVLINAYNMAKRGTLFRRKSYPRTKDLARRYEALGITKDEIDLNNVRFLAARASQCGIRSVFIKPSGKVEFHQKACRECDEERILFPKPKGLFEFKTIIESLYDHLTPFNEDESRLIDHAYSLRFGDGDDS